MKLVLPTAESPKKHILNIFSGTPLQTFGFGVVNSAIESKVGLFS